MQKFLKYAAVAAVAVAVPAMVLAAPLTQPTVPVGGGNAVTAGTIETIISQIVNFLITISVVVAVGVIVWGGLTYMRDPSKGKEILKNGIIGVAIILGVGLILNTVARFVQTQSLF